MGDNNKTLPFDGCVELINKIIDDFVVFANNPQPIPSKLTYKIASRRDNAPEIAARKAAIRNIEDGLFLKKLAFDTRLIPKNQRIPRKNLQVWNRSEEFIDSRKHNQIKTFSRLIEPLDNIKKYYGEEPEYHDSYARKLHDLISRALRVKEEDLEVYAPQLEYIEQLLDTRYRLSMEDVSKMDKLALETRILSKDEDLLQRGRYLKATEQEKKISVIKDGNNGITQESIVNAIFGNNNIRRDGEKTVERTITITIRDEVVE